MIAQLLDEAKTAVATADNLGQLDRVRVKYLGKKGAFTAELKELGRLPVEQRPGVGKEINAAKQTLATLVNERREELEARRVESELATQAIDVTLAGRGQPLGRLHPVSRSLRRMIRILSQAGFEVRQGPEVETEYYNFGALNFPENHPAREMHDTFYLDSGRLLRTHTSPVQIRAMEAQSVPIRIIAPGRVFRCDSDLTHTPMFSQVEGLAVDRGVSFANLKALLYDFVSQFFEREVELRFRPSYFPFTEPSAEVDILSESGRWLEILGCGMVHPNVLKNVGVDPDEYSGYAFGMGVERLTMLRYGVDDLRLFFENDMRFLSQFT